MIAIVAVFVQFSNYNVTYFVELYFPDILINNAGILRDRTFQRMSENEWDIIQKVHVKGTFSTTKAAWEVMKQQKFGRVIMTSSGSGIYGNFGQSNYSAAKLAVLGLANTLSLEGKKHNILVNTIAPGAYTRMRKGLPTKSIIADHLKPEYVAPLVVYLCHESCTETGSLFQVEGGIIYKLRWQRTKGALLREVGKEMKAEDVRDNWNVVVNWDDAEVIKTIGESTMKAGEAISRILAGENDLASNHPINPRLAKKHVFEPSVTTYTERDVIAYALGVGVSTSQEDHLKFLFERSPDFCVLPSFGVIPPFRDIDRQATAEGLSYKRSQVLHGEHYLELFKPIPVSGTLTNKSKIVEVLDKGSGAAIITDMETFDEDGSKIFYNQLVTFVVGSGGFRGKRSSDVLKPVMKTPQRVHDAEVEERTNKDQAALYRLSGDYNPLHIDPSFAAMGGFKEPILHGLCSFGYATRHVMKTFANNDPARIKAIKVRFSNPVLPGQTLRTLMWKEGNRVYFQTDVKETGAVCLNGAYIDLNDSSIVLASDDVIGDFSKHLSEETVRRLGAIIQWDIEKDGEVVKSWMMDLSKGSGNIREAVASYPGLIVTLSDQDALNIFSGKLDIQEAHSQGKLKLKGVTLLLRKMNLIFSLAHRL